MRAGLFLAYWPWFSPAEPVELAVLADELGLDSVWIPEGWYGVPFARPVARTREYVEIVEAIGA
jgi:alkanesulfonate monooxygenase SsuD/methylene tetrahydromethanopterin reductase-like flavin-dependent oxidoreductase (luciferase family)